MIHSAVVSPTPIDISPYKRHWITLFARAQASPHTAANEMLANPSFGPTLERLTKATGVVIFALKDGGALVAEQHQLEGRLLDVGVSVKRFMSSERELSDAAWLSQSRRSKYGGVLDEESQHRILTKVFPVEQALSQLVVDVTKGMHNRATWLEQRIKMLVARSGRAQAKIPKPYRRSPDTVSDVEEVQPHHFMELLELTPPCDRKLARRYLGAQRALLRRAPRYDAEMKLLAVQFDRISEVLRERERLLSRIEGCAQSDALYELYPSPLIDFVENYRRENCILFSRSG